MISICSALLLGAVGWTSLAFAQGDVSGPMGQTAAALEPAASPVKQERLEAFDPNAPPVATIPIGPYLTFGGRAELEIETDRNFDLNEERADSLSLVQPRLSLAFSFDPSRHFQLYVNPVLTRELAVEEDGEDRRRKTRLELGLAFAALKEIEGFSLYVGRQRFKDHREWLYDDELDAARLLYRYERFTLELSANRKNLFDRDVLNKDEEGETERFRNYFMYANYRLAEEVDIAVFGLAQDDRTSEDEDPIHLGLQSEGEVLDDLEYWAQFAHVRGRDGSEKIRGIGLDLGVTYEFDDPIKPSITVGYAYGSGDDDPNDNRDEAFRQTGFQDNADKFNGVTRFKYYGEVLDPELSNLMIFTAGFGVKPSPRSSLDLVYHYDLQHEAAPRIREDELDARPTGRSRRLGSEVDLIVGYREVQNFDTALVLGYFIPDDAFPGTTDDPAFLANLELRFSF